MFKNILVPVDLAHVDQGKSLASAAKKLAGKRDCDLTLLNVVPEVPPYVAVQLDKGLPEIIVSTAQAGLRKIAEEQELAASTQVKVLHGHPAQEILKAATDAHTDLILIASHQSGLSDYLLGSVAGRVVRHAQCSVLVLR